MDVLSYIRDTALDKMKGTEYYRHFLPLIAVNGADNGITGAILNAEHMEVLNGIPDSYDIYHFSRMAHEDCEDVIDVIHGWGGKFVVDTDDDLTENYKLVSGRGEQFKKVLSLADYVTVSTPSLARELSAYTKEYPVVLRNCIGTVWMYNKAASGKRVVEGLTIGFSGSPTHWGDWRMPAVPLQRICRDYDVAPILHGEVPRYLKYIADEDRLTVLGGVPFSIYPVLLSQFDIVLCAVDALDRFNSGKSAIKALECMAVEAIPICSRFEPYIELYEAGAPIVLVEENSQDAWYDAMAKVIEYEDYRKELKAKGLPWVKNNRDMAGGYIQWENFYNEISNA